MDILRQFFSSLIGAIAISLLYFAPFAAVAWWLVRRRKNLRASALDPFTDMPLRPPGESLRLKIQDLGDEFDQWLSLGAIACVAAATFTTTLDLDSKRGIVSASIIWGLILGLCLWLRAKLAGLQQRLWDYRLGFTGERVVGEALNQLLADGFQVFHDVPFDTYNLDHVIVGPVGVYVVETKTRRKPASIKGTARATVAFDGSALHYPWGRETQGIEQASRNANTLSRWLTTSTGEPTPVSAILALPGWWVERRVPGAVNVLNPKEIRRSFPTRPSVLLSPERIQRIAHQLTERCRLEKPAT